MKKPFIFNHAALMATTAVLCGSLLLSGCAGGKTAQTGGKVTYPEGGVYPVSSEDTLTVWRGINGTLSNIVPNFGDSELAKELEKRTGIKVKYLHPAGGLESEQFNLLVSSDDMPDIIAYLWRDYGTQTAIDENIILPLNDVIDKWAPNYKKVLDDNPKLAAMMKASEGSYYAFSFLRGDESLCTWMGPIVRKDWLDELGLPIPETLDDWERTLTAFKEKKGADAAFSLINSDAFANGVITGAFGFADTFYVDNGVVKYGPLEAGYKEFLSLMADWAGKGLVDKNMAGSDRKILTNNVLNGKTGLTFLEAGGGIGTWTDAKRGVGDTKFSMVGAPFPVKNKGDKVEFGHYDWAYVMSNDHVITTNCKNPELAARWLDYGYSEEGHMLYNYGVEGKTYDMVNGVPTFSDFTTKNPDGLTMNQVLVQYTTVSYSGPMVQEKEAVDATRTYPEQNDAIALWSQTNMKEHLLPYMNLSSSDSAELSTILTNLKTYKDEMLYSFIYGTESLDEYDTFIERIKEIGAERALEIYQKGLEQYNQN